jgi:tryptophan halogenase
MDERQKKRVVIAGGGTAGWLAAAILTRQLGSLLDITLVESEEIGTIGVGESTVPTIRAFHALLGLDEREFMAETGATFKLGISFEGWTRADARYVHSFGDVGKSTWMADFQHIWLDARARGLAGDLGDYCYELQAGEAGRIATGPDAAPINYAYHLDAARYARFLRKRCEAAGLKRVEGRIARVELNPQGGTIAALVLADEQRIEGDLFLDCTGFRALLIGEALGVGFEDWGDWLPTNRAVAIQTTSTRPPIPYTSAIAHEAGWRWNIPLQHRVGNGFVYAADYLSDDEAHARLLAAVEGETVREPWRIRFRTGRRHRAWEGNCIAIALAGGFVEPLESTSIHMMMATLTRLVQQFPFDGIHPAVVARFNDQARRELEGIRDFIILHYHLNDRPEPFWRRHREATPPDSLSERIALFAESAHAYQGPEELFRVTSWVQVLYGQGVRPRDYHQVGRLMTDSQLGKALSDLKSNIDRAVARLPSQQAFIDSYCKERVETHPPPHPATAA